MFRQTAAATKSAGSKKYFQKRKGEIFSVDKNNPLPEILNCTRSLVWAVTGAEERRSSARENLIDVDSFMLESFR